MAQLEIREHSGHRYIQTLQEVLGEKPSVNIGYGDGEGEPNIIRHFRLPGDWIVSIVWPPELEADDVVPEIRQDI